MSTARLSTARLSAVRLSRARGFALPMVVFFMVMVAMLVGGMTQLSILNRAGTDLELQSERARWVARAAVDYWRYHASTAGAPLCELALPAADGFRVVVEDCGLEMLTLRAESANGDLGSPDYVSWRETAVLH